MRYRIMQLENGPRAGQWVVKAPGGKYYTRTARATEQEAQEQALIKSVQWYHDKALESYEALVKHNPAEYTAYHSAREYNKCTYGDLLA
jgi:hypothetical protein